MTTTQQLNNPLNFVQMTRTQLNGTIEGLISFDGEEPAWIPINTINAMYSYMNKTIGEL
jgi:hypothetical protein